MLTVITCHFFMMLVKFTSSYIDGESQVDPPIFNEEPNVIFEKWSKKSNLNLEVVEVSN